MYVVKVNEKEDKEVLFLEEEIKKHAYIMIQYNLTSNDPILGLNKQQCSKTFTKLLDWLSFQTADHILQLLKTN